MSDFPGGGADVPSLSNHLGKDNQVWERPWSLGEMRQASANWSLAADSGLFLFLQDFSQRMLSKTHDIEKQLDGLIRDTKATDSCLHSVFNDFLMLSNTQFIENRVYDEEVEEPSAKVESAVKHPEQEKTREQKEAELIPKMQEAVNYGLRVLDSAFEQLDIKAGNSDSEDEEATDRVEAILEPKDLYVDRPLPYLIGSQAFMEQDDVGLGDLSSDEMSIDSDRDSVIESEDGKEEVQSDEEFEEAEGRGSINKKSSVLSYEEDEEEDEDSDIFGESDKEEEYEDENERKTAGSSSFVDELAGRIKGEPVSKGEEDRASLASSKKKAKSKKVPKAEKSPAAAAAAAAVREDSDDMFQPPRMEDEEFSPFGGKGGLFSGGRGLFDDDDEGDLFADAPKPAVSEDKAKSAAHKAESVQPEKKIPAGAVSIFPADNGLFGSGHSTASAEGKENSTHGKPKAHPSTKQPPVRASGIGGGLFDDEEEDDFFSGRSLTTSRSAGHEKSKTKKVADLFLGDDEDEEDGGDIFSEKSAVQPPAHNKQEVVEEKAKPPEKKMPAGAISIFGPGTKSLMTESLRRRRASLSEGSEKSEENGPPVEAPVSHTPVNQTQISQARGLFSDDEDTQAIPTTSISKSKPGAARQPKAPSALFDDEEEEDLFASVAKSKQKPNQAKATTPQPQKTVSLFSDDEDVSMECGPALPDSLVLEIFLHLPHDAVLSAGLACRQWLAVSRDEFLWRELFYSYYRIPRSVPRHPGVMMLISHYKQPEKILAYGDITSDMEWNFFVSQIRLKIILPSVSWYREFKRLYDCIACEEVQTLTGHHDQVLHLAFSHRGHRFSSCSKDCTIKLWDTERPDGIISLVHSSSMLHFNWAYTQFSQFNADDTLLLVSGLYLGPHQVPTISGEIAVISLDNYTLLSRVRNKPYDVFGCWLNESHLISGNRHWIGNITSCSVFWLNKAFQDEKVINPERAEEAKLKSRYPNLGHKRGGSGLLRKRRQKGQKYFDSGDYNMAKAKIKNKQRPTAAPEKTEITTGRHILTPLDLPQRKPSLVASKLAG